MTVHATVMTMLDTLLSAVLLGSRRLGRRARKVTPPVSDERRPAAGTYLLMALAIGCSAAGEGPLPARPEACTLRVTFDAASADAGPLAIDRINAATGCSLRESPDGLPVTVTQRLLWKGAEYCGFAWPDHIEISTADMCSGYSLDTAIAHELVHVMTGTDAHPETGLASIGAEPPMLDESSVSWICSHVDCPSFSPE